MFHPKEVIERWLDAGITHIRVRSPLPPGVDVGPVFSAIDPLVLKLSRQWACTDDLGVRATLTNAGHTYEAFIPWEAIAVVSSSVVGQSIVWELPPAPVPVQQRVRHLRLVKPGEEN